MANFKNANIERLRIIASFGIVFFHSKAGLLGFIGYAGLPIFVMLTFSLGIVKQDYTSKQNSSSILKRYLTVKTKRLILPYIFWVFTYLCWGLARSMTGHGEIIEVPLTILFPLYGTSIHLWYLPFVFIFLAIISFLKLYCPVDDLKLMSFYLIVILVTGIATAAVDFGFGQLPTPIPQILFALPAVSLGLIISDMFYLNNFAKYCLSLLFITTAGIIRLFLTARFDSFLILYTIAFFLVVICQNYPGQMDRYTSHLSSLTFGIYLIHPIIIAISANMAHIAQIDLSTTTISLIVFIISAIITDLILKTQFKIFV